jgi:hypothetical protein
LKILNSQYCHTYVPLFCESIETVLKGMNREPSIFLLKIATEEKRQIKKSRSTHPGRAFSR